MSFPRYPKYKDSGVEWLGEVPEHWDICALSYRHEVALGKMLDEKRITGKHLAPYLRNTDVQWGRINIEELPQMDFEGDDLVRYGLRKGDLLVCEGGDVGRAAIWDAPIDECYYQKALHRIRPADPNRDSPRFLCSVLRAANSLGLFSSSGGKSTIAHLTAEDLRRYRLPFPPIAEQMRIAEFLERETGKIDELVAEQQRLMELLKKKRQAVISHAVTKGLNPRAPMKPSGIEWLGDVPEHWEVTRIKRLASIISKGTTPTTVGAEFTDDGVRFLKAENVTEMGVSAEPEFFISQESHTLLSRSSLDDGDVLVVIAGATTGKSAVLGASLLPANTNQAVSFIRPQDRKLSEHISLWLGTTMVRNLITLNSVQSAQPNLSMEDLGNLPLPLPPSEELETIRSYLTRETAKLDALAAEAQKAIDLLQERRTALISAAVTGQIDVRKLAAA
jgi:type I restriction enzyme S subunit